MIVATIVVERYNPTTSNTDNVTTIVIDIVVNRTHIVEPFVDDALLTNSDKNLLRTTTLTKVETC